MPQVMFGRYSAQVEGPFVVFLIGLKVNRLWAVHKWWRPFVATIRVLRFLKRTPPDGYLGGELFLYGRGVAMVQYWKTFDRLEAFSHDGDAPHLQAWKDLARQTRTDPTFGFWHETYQVEPGGYECIYGNMPKFGLARFTNHVPVTSGSETARARLKEGK